MRCAANTNCCSDVGGLIGESVRRTDPLRELQELDFVRVVQIAERDPAPMRRCPC